MMRARRKIDGGLKAKIALEALGERATVNDLAQRCQVHPNPIYAWKKQLLDHGARAFDPKVGLEVEAASARGTASQARSREWRSVDPPAMGDAGLGALGRLSQAPSGQ